MHEDRIREIVRELFDTGEVDLVIGWEEGTLPFRTSPLICRQRDQAERLVWNPFCGSNLARYLKYYKGREEKIGLCVKGCDSRAVNVLVREEQIERERLVLVGLPCHGLINPQKLLEKFPGLTPADVEWKEDTLLIQGQQEESIPLLESSCARCLYPDPPVYDYLVGEKRGKGLRDQAVRKTWLIIMTI